MAEVFDFLRGQQQHLHLEADLGAVRARGHHGGLAGLAVVQAGDLHHLVALEAKRLRVLAVQELAGQHAHADQVRTVDSLESFRHHRLHAQQVRALGRPVTRRAGAVFLAREHHQRHALGLVLHGRVVDRHLFARRVVDGVAAFFAAQHQVLDADVGEGAAHHHVVVAAARAVAVEVGRLHAATLQELAGRRAGLDVAGRADVVGGDRIAEQAHDAGVVDVGDGADVHLHAVEVGRVLDVGGGLVPGELGAVRGLDFIPAAVAGEDVGVVGLEHFRADRARDEVADFLVAGPDVLEEHRLAVAARAQRLGAQVDVHRAGDGVGHHQRRRSQVVHLHFRVHAALEVAVA